MPDANIQTLIGRHPTQTDTGDIMLELFISMVAIFILYLMGQKLLPDEPKLAQDTQICLLEKKLSEDKHDKRDAQPESKVKDDGDIKFQQQEG